MMYSHNLVRNFRRFVLAALFALSAPALANAEGQPIDGGAYWIWTGLDQSTCLARAATAMQAAASAFQIPATAQNPAGWYVALVGTADVHAGVHCIPDNDTTNLIGSGRVLMVITFSSTRGGVTSGDFLRFVDQCVQSGSCPGSTSIVGKWTNPGGWGEITIRAENGRFVGTYTAQCPGATIAGGFDLSLLGTYADGDHYAGTWGEDICSGQITDLYIDAEGLVRVTNSWAEFRGNAQFQPLPAQENPLRWARQ